MEQNSGMKKERKLRPGKEDSVKKGIQAKRERSRLRKGNLGILGNVDILPELPSSINQICFVFVFTNRFEVHVRVCS